ESHPLRGIKAQLDARRHEPRLRPGVCVRRSPFDPAGTAGAALDAVDPVLDPERTTAVRATGLRPAVSLVRTVDHERHRAAASATAKRKRVDLSENQHGYTE